MPLGNVGYENPVNERGERLIWLERSVVDLAKPMLTRNSFRAMG
jgi:hypothetical protein